MKKKEWNRSLKEFWEVEKDNFTWTNEEIVSIFKKPDLEPLKDEEGVAFHYALVGNIIGKHAIGEEKEIVYGTKHFSTNNKSDSITRIRLYVT